MFLMDEYFKRIGYAGKPAADMQTLRALHQLHPAAIPFENIEVLLGRGINLKLPAVFEKLVTAGRGGYCFEHNGVLMEVLRSIGFTVEPLLARVVWRRPADAAPGPKSHMVLRTFVDGQPWLVDVGFGGLVLTAPLHFNADVVQNTQHESFRLITVAGGYRLEALLEDQWRPVYVLGSEPVPDIDFEVANWYTSSHPESHFRHNLMVARTTEDTRYTLLNYRLTVRKRGAEPVRRELDPAELVDVLSEQFLLPHEPEWEARLASLPRE